MNDETNENKRSAEDMMEDVLSKLSEISDLENKIEESKHAMSDLIVVLKNNFPDFVAKLSTKTGYKGYFYSIRSRYNSLLKRDAYYICKKDEAFGSWLKKKKDKKDEPGTENEDLSVEP